METEGQRKNTIPLNRLQQSQLIYVLQVEINSGGRANQSCRIIATSLPVSLLPSLNTL